MYNIHDWYNIRTYDQTEDLYNILTESWKNEKKSWKIFVKLLDKCKNL